MRMLCFLTVYLITNQMEEHKPMGSGFSAGSVVFIASLVFTLTAQEDFTYKLFLSETLCLELKINKMWKSVRCNYAQTHFLGHFVVYEFVPKCYRLNIYK